MDDAGQQLSRNLVHAGNHEHQTLRGGERRAQQTSREGAVQRTRSAGLGLHDERGARANTYFHFGNHDLLSEHVLQSLVCPVVAVLAHARGRGDGEQHGRIGDLINGVGSGFITINGHSLMCASTAGNHSFGKRCGADTVISGNTSHSTLYKSIKHLSGGSMTNKANAIWQKESREDGCVVAGMGAFLPT